MRHKNVNRIPAVVENEILASRMERALRKPDPDQQEVERERRFVKAGTYTLAEKYALTLDGFKERKR